MRKEGWKREVFFDELNSEAGLLRCRYLFCDSHPDELFRCNETTLAPVSAESRLVHEGNGFNIFERVLWLPVTQEDGIFSLIIDG